MEHLILVEPETLEKVVGSLEKSGRELEAHHIQMQCALQATLPSHRNDIFPVVAQMRYHGTKFEAALAEAFAVANQAEGRRLVLAFPGEFRRALTQVRG